MKRTIFALTAALTFGVSATAMANEIAPIDIFVGDFAGVISVDFDKLAANKMIGDAASSALQSSGAGGILDEFKALGVDVKKDIDLVTVAVNERGHGCAVVDAKVDLTKLMEAEAKKDSYTKSEYKGLTLLADKSETMVLVGTKRIIGCQNKIDIKPIIDNVKAEKPKTLKESNATLFKAYQLSDSKADIRFGGKMTKRLKEKVQTYSLSAGEGKSIAASDVDSGAVSISFSNGLDVKVVASGKSEEVAKMAADVLNAKYQEVVGSASQELEQMGLGFVKKSVKIAPDKKNLKINVKLTDAELGTLVGLAGGAVASAPSVTKGATK